MKRKSIEELLKEMKEMKKTPQQELAEEIRNANKQIEKQIEALRKLRRRIA